MRISNKGLVEIAGHEGICLSKYKDSVGVWTIGIGATRTEIPDLASWPMNKTITIQEAFDLLAKSITKYEDEINKYLTRTILQTQFDALVSWCYNVGTGWVSKASVIKHVNAGADNKTLYDSLMMFNKPKEIIHRRMKEANLLAYGRYGNDGRANLFPVSSKGYPMYSKGKLINVWEYIGNTSEIDPNIFHIDNEDEKQAEVKPGLINSLLNLFKRDN